MEDVIYVCDGKRWLLCRQLAGHSHGYTVIAVVKLETMVKLLVEKLRDA